ncbi:hypothetical protein IF1G_04348 [Cordyceps javanica]|uniref:Uncharacterized protein n=1 Tax=Cordyceps javanica TaxID=43265 RepID=A0A545V603_9HYPO|nr:hypothetical protein IF1G_04348 [Cordyceps javanica]
MRGHHSHRQHGQHGRSRWFSPSNRPTCIVPGCLIVNSNLRANPAGQALHSSKGEARFCGGDDQRPLTIFNTQEQLVHLLLFLPSFFPSSFWHSLAATRFKRKRLHGDPAWNDRGGGPGLLLVVIEMVYHQS